MIQSIGISIPKASETDMDMVPAGQSKFAFREAKLPNDHGNLPNCWLGK